MAIIVLLVLATLGKLLPDNPASTVKNTDPIPTPIETEVAAFSTFTQTPLGGDFRPLAITSTASATITDTVTPPTPTWTTTPASAYRVTPRSPTLYYVLRTANLRACPNTTCESLGKFQQGDTFTVDGIARGGDVQGDNLWYQTNYNGQIAYVHRSLVYDASLVSQPQPTQALVQAQSPVVVQAQQPSGFTCPRNCATAVAMGLTEQQAGTCSNLDRDSDDKACYGD